MIKILKYGEVANKDIFARVIPTFNVEEIVADIIATYGAEIIRFWYFDFDEVIEEIAENTKL